MKVKQLLNEGLGDEAHSMEMDHEVQMARAQLYNAAKDAIRLHRIMQQVSEATGIEGWVAAKITLAADYLKSVADYMEYEQMGAPNVISVPVPEDASGGATGAGAIGAVSKPLGRGMIRRKQK